MAVVDLLAEFFGRIDGGIDVAPQACLRCRQGVRYGGERRVTHDEHVYVAIPAQLAPRRGTEDECHADLVRPRRNTLGREASHLGSDLLDALIQPEITVCGSHVLAFPFCTIV